MDHSSQLPSLFASTSFRDGHRNLLLRLLPSSKIGFRYPFVTGAKNVAQFVACWSGGWWCQFCWSIAWTAHAVVRLKWRLALGFGLYSAMYVAAFYLVARVCYFLIRMTRRPLIITPLQIAVLLALIGCSFLRVRTYSSFQGRGGTYTFWTAGERFEEQRFNR